MRASAAENCGCHTAFEWAGKGHRTFVSVAAFNNYNLGAMVSVRVSICVVESIRTSWKYLSLRNCKHRRLWAPNFVWIGSGSHFRVTVGSLASAVEHLTYQVAFRAWAADLCQLVFIMKIRLGYKYETQMKASYTGDYLKLHSPNGQSRNQPQSTQLQRVR